MSARIIDYKYQMAAERVDQMMHYRECSDGVLKTIANDIEYMEWLGPTEGKISIVVMPRDYPRTEDVKNVLDHVYGSVEDVTLIENFTLIYMKGDASRISRALDGFRERMIRTSTDSGVVMKPIDVNLISSHTLMLSPGYHVLAPQYIKRIPFEAVDEFLAEEGLDKNQLQMIHREDSMAQWIGGQLGDIIINLHRQDQTGIYNYRLVVNKGEVSSNNLPMSAMTTLPEPKSPASEE